MNNKKLRFLLAVVLLLVVGCHVGEPLKNIILPKHHGKPTTKASPLTHHEPLSETESESCNTLLGRRDMLYSTAWLMGGVGTGSGILMPPSSSAGEVGARITKAVTTSDLGISVRTSVVKGAQVIDQLDGKWEKFSDRFSLGAERSKRDGRPPPKVIPPPSPLDVSIAEQFLTTSDRIFLSLTKLSVTDLTTQLEKVSTIVRPSFERSGLVFLEEDEKTKNSIINFKTASQFNFASYVHFKAYSDLILARGIDFRPFRRQFETQVGQGIVSILLPGWEPSLPVTTTTNNNALKPRLMQNLQTVDQLCQALEKAGLVAQTERSTIEEDVIADWVEDMADIQFTIALDGDITLNAQILLQEQGFLLYPNFARFAIQTVLEQPGQKVSCEDYYFDTDYNSDPDKFEVKEVLLNIVLEGSD